MTVGTFTWDQSVQWGSAEGATIPNSTWLTLAFGLPSGILLDATAGINRRAGVIFDASSEQTLRMLSGQVAEGPILLGMTFRATFQRPTAFEGGGTDNRVEVFLVPDPTPEDFSGTDPPATRDVPLNRGDLSIGTFTLTLPNDLDIQTIDIVLGADATTQARRLMSSAFWNARVAFSIASIGTSTLRLANDNTVGPITIITRQESLWFGGLTGGPAGKIRAVRDGRYAMPAWNTDLVRDGDQPGLFVRPFDWDPEDEQETYRPKPGEGTTEDEVPNL